MTRMRASRRVRQGVKDLIYMEPTAAPHRPTRHLTKFSLVANRHEAVGDVEVRTDVINGRHLIASCDLPSGHVVYASRAYALAPYEEHEHDHLVESSKKNARAQHMHRGARFASLGATDYKLRQQLYSSDNFLDAPRASTMAGGGGVPNARESRMPPSNRFGPTTFFRGRLSGAATEVLLRPGTA